MTTGTSTPQYIPSGDAMLCYDCGAFHPNCTGVVLNYPYLFCPACKVAAHIDLVASHVTTQSCCYARRS